MMKCKIIIIIDLNKPFHKFFSQNVKIPMIKTTFESK